MAEHEGTDQLFFRFAVLLGIDQHGQCSGNTLIPTARITHYRYHSACHTGIARTGRIRKDMGEYAVTQNLVFIIAT